MEVEKSPTLAVKWMKLATARGNAQDKRISGILILTVSAAKYVSNEPALDAAQRLLPL